MKILSLILILSVISVSMIATGCSSETMTRNDVSQNSDSSELDFNEEVIDPDIGELDDIAVSDELPQ